MPIVELAPHHAADAARLHIAGQPGSFLTALGLDVLAVLYQALPASSVGFGFAAVECAEGPLTTPLQSDPAWPTSEKVCGFVSATTSTGRLFVELSTRRLAQFLPPLLRVYARQPRLAWLTMQTLFYPLLAGDHAGQDDRQAAELLSIMVEPARRGQGVGAALLQALATACQMHQISLLTVTVDAANAGARRFYERHGFQMMRGFVLYGRSMCRYWMELESRGD
jgi:ribosomal protein S18 acetylase RimI-like enzyme